MTGTSVRSTSPGVASATARAAQTAPTKQLANTSTPWPGDAPLHVELPLTRYDRNHHPVDLAGRLRLRLYE